MSSFMFMWFPWPVEQGLPLSLSLPLDPLSPILGLPGWASVREDVPIPAETEYGGRRAWGGLPFSEERGWRQWGRDL